MTRRRILITAALVLYCAALSFAGSVLAVRAAGPAVTTFTLGTVETRVGPTASGRFDVYVPIVDWGIRAHPYAAPLRLSAGFGGSMLILWRKPSAWRAVNRPVPLPLGERPL